MGNTTAKDAKAGPHGSPSAAPTAPSQQQNSHQPSPSSSKSAPVSGSTPHTSNTATSASAATTATVRDGNAASATAYTGDTVDSAGGRSAPQAVPEKRGGGGERGGGGGGGGRFVEEGDDELNVFGSPLLSPLEHAPVVSMPESAPSRFEVSAQLSAVSQPVTLSWRGPEPKKSIKLMGSFNDWSEPIALKKNSAGVYEVKLNLKPGAYEYKFVVDSQWLHDTAAPTVRNSFGSVNNLLSVAAGGDGAASGHTSLGNKFDSATSFVDSEAPPRAASPPGSYGQVVPDLYSASAPPPLPPHLLQVTLNEEAVHGDPTQLPEPNHVMLSHLYALTIRDNVIVLGATHRYLKKYVTTVIYKPLQFE